MVQSDDNYGPGLLKLKFCLKTGIPQASDEDRPIGVFWCCFLYLKIFPITEQGIVLQQI